MAKDITLQGATYQDVPAVDLPQAGGGTARFVDADDITGYFLVNVWFDDEQTNNWVSDKTYNEIMSAYNDGELPILVDLDSYNQHWYLWMMGNHEMYFYSPLDDGTGWSLYTIDDQNVVGRDENYYPDPVVNNGTLTIQRNGTTVGTFTANQSGNTTANISVPTQAYQIDFEGMPGSITEQAQNVERAIQELDYAVQQSSAPNDGTLTISEDGTTVDTFTANQATNTTIDFGNCAFFNANTVASGVDAPVIGFDMDLLWENANPTSNFSAQTINADLTDYGQILVVFRQATSTVYVNKISLLIPDKGVPYAVTALVSSYLRIRSATATNSGVEFTKNQNMQTYTSSLTDDNSCLIPVAIYGIRCQVNDLTGD